MNKRLKGNVYRATKIVQSVDHLILTSSDALLQAISLEFVEELDSNSTQLSFIRRNSVGHGIFAHINFSKKKITQLEQILSVLLSKHIVC